MTETYIIIEYIDNARTSRAVCASRESVSAIAACGPHDAICR